MMADVRDLWMRTVNDGVTEGVFTAPDPKIATLTILTLCSSTSAWFKPRREYTPEEVASYTAACALRILGYTAESVTSLAASADSPPLDRKRSATRGS